MTGNHALKSNVTNIRLEEVDLSVASVEVRNIVASCSVTAAFPRVFLAYDAIATAFRWLFRNGSNTSSTHKWFSLKATVARIVNLMAELQLLDGKSWEAA